MSTYRKQGKLEVNELLYQFIEQEVLPGTKVDSTTFWKGAEDIISELQPGTEAALEIREEIQKKLDSWHRENPGTPDPEKYHSYLKDIGYLEPEGEDVTVTTSNLDKEVTEQAGPQLVVPVNNARYAINAANARWGSLYDALYGTDVIPEKDGAEKTGAYNPKRGEKVIAYAREFLDEHFPLEEGSHKDVSSYQIKNGSLTIEAAGMKTLKNPAAFLGHRGKEEDPEAVILINNSLHVEIQIDRTHPIGKTDKAGIKDVMLEAATTTIVDAEDSVAAVDAEDKVGVYRNWLGLMKGDLSTTFKKGAEEVKRTLSEDRTYTGKNGEGRISGRSLLLMRNVGHLMTTDMIKTADGKEIPEGIADALITSLIAKHDLLKNGRFQNSKTGSIYIVKPKMHGSQEVKLTNALMTRVEEVIGVPKNTIKIGVMDEERRTSLNLKQCIREVKERVFFINTGFLDRTGDEIHTSFLGGAMIRKGDMKQSVWLSAYEESNVYQGLHTALYKRGQIGKGMWPMPDEMKQMMEQKSGHLLAGGNTAWVPSPTAAALHAMHYHQIDTKQVQTGKLQTLHPRAEDMLQIPLEADPSWEEQDRRHELENNAQGILGYVVRWVEQGVGCSKVPDLNNVHLMEDRATLRIASQHMANWLEHGICSKEEIRSTMEKMARLVDKQNEGDPDYLPMAPDFDHSTAFQAALELVLEGKHQPSGYTEPILHRRRREFKAKQLQHQ
ncbi:malate synthase G [Alkalicoccus halolimnae]|uniref:Malate synthase G n=1 Tax=Alkalicoccus halolimnae TaxID=1667239 RepID=A0A5C7FBR4_9BACI|nr:malate synthase G [Alkalicoccus halolimnae]TXF86898.1 malate synthase G [Alkalicoccus halolimnae]